jgi:hypothetical protein
MSVLKTTQQPRAWLNSSRSGGDGGYRDSRKVLTGKREQRGQVKEAQYPARHGTLQQRHATIHGSVEWVPRCSIWVSGTLNS